jgi:hypothetical protein
VADVPEQACDPASVLGAQPLEIAEIVADAIGRHGRVFPRRPPRVLARDLAVADAPFADLPDLGDLLGVLVELDAQMTALVLDGVHEVFGLSVRFVLGVGAELHQQPSVAVRQQLRMALEAFDQLVAHEPAVERLEPDRAEFRDPRHLVGGARAAVVADQHQRAMLWAGDQLAAGLEHQAAGRLRPDHRCRQIELAFRQ